MSNRLLGAIRSGWQDATPSQRLVIGIGGTGGALSAANFANNAVANAQARKKQELEEKSLRALQSINKKLTQTS